MLTAAMGMLIDGPVGSINHNLDQVVNSLTCMYEQMKVMACRYQVQFQSIFQQVGEMLRGAKFRKKSILRNNHNEIKNRCPTDNDPTKR